jgi:hypothetical protein
MGRIYLALIRPDLLSEPLFRPMTSFPPLKTSSSSSWVVENACQSSPRVVKVVTVTFVIIDK